MIYVDNYESETIYLLTAYPKNVQEDMTGDQKKALQQIIEQIKKG